MVSWNCEGFKGLSYLNCSMKSREQNSNFQTDCGGGGGVFKPKTFLWGRYGCFLIQLNVNGMMLKLEPGKIIQHVH